MDLLPLKLQQHIAEARIALYNNELHDLRPIYRLRIYQALTDDPAKAQLAFTQLSVLGTEYALSDKQKLLQDNNTSYILDTAKQLLRGQIDQATARTIETEAAEASNELQEEPLFVFAYEAALSTLGAALGYPYFGDCPITDKTKNGELDPWCSDAAKWASFAVAERPWVASANHQSRLAFWLWWLDEAIPTAVTESE